jgi:hypothetical protein
MIEIAISLGVIAFALIAIIGILPTGLQTQRDNREDTLANQDARLLIEAIKTGGRDTNSDLGSFVVNTDGVPVTVGVGIPTTNLIQLLTDMNGGPNGPYHEIIFKSISGAATDRGTNDFGFFYQVRNHVMPSPDFTNGILSNQMFEVRLRFAWPVLDPTGTPKVGPEANSFVVRTLVSGWRTNDVFYAQQYYQPLTNWAYITNWP